MTGQDVDAIFREFIGQRCVAVTAGLFPIGPLSIGCGIVRHRMIRGRMVDWASHSLFVTCSWRIRAGEEFVTTSWAEDRDERDFCPSMLRGCELLKGAVLEHLSLDSETCDLILRFEGNVWLDVFCDQAFEVDIDYSFDIEERHFVVGRGRIDEMLDE